jgi:hypothetical protein
MRCRLGMVMLLLLGLMGEASIFDFLNCSFLNV